MAASCCWRHSGRKTFAGRLTHGGVLKLIVHHISRYLVNSMFSDASRLQHAQFRAGARCIKSGLSNVSITFTA